MPDAKPTEVKIIQITSTWAAHIQMSLLFGLGDDQKVYIWDHSRTKWFLHDRA